MPARASVKYGNIPTLFVANILWGLICIYAYYIQTPFQFYLVAGLVGMVMGGLQSTSEPPILNICQTQKILPLTLVFMESLKK